MTEETIQKKTSITTSQAFVIHLSLSILIFASLVFVMVAFWFPGELFLLDGGWTGLKLVAIVDLVLGPMLTLVLFKPGKPKLIMDMSLIAAIQIGALAYGFITTYDQRTVALVYADSTFITISSQAHETANSELVQLELQPQAVTELDSERPAMLLTPPPDRANFGKYLTDLLNGFPEPHERSDKYVKLTSSLETIKSSALDDKTLETMGMLDVVNKAVADGGFESDTIEFHRFKARYADGVAIFNPKAGKILDYVKTDEGTGFVAEAETAEDENADNADDVKSAEAPE